MSKPAIIERVFDGSEAVVELYNLAKISISMSLPSFKELFYFDKLQRRIAYFQPRYILRGGSYCTHESPEFKTNV